MSANAQFATPPPAINLPNLSVPPPIAPNLSTPPPNLMPVNTSTGGGFQHRYLNHREGSRGFFKPFRPYHAPKIVSGGGQDALQDEFDGKRLRKSVMRKTVDYNSAIIKSLENRVWQRDYRDRRALQPDVIYYPDLLPPPSYIDNPMNAVTTRFVKTATNKMRCPIFCMAWTPEGRRLVTGASSGEFTLWNGLTFNFETILQAHDSPVRTMVWSHNESWMITGDHAGYVKYWQSNMNNVKMFKAHINAIRGLSFCQSDRRFATCSDDASVRIWDFQRCQDVHSLTGHGADVKCIDWHPHKNLLASGSKDNQQPIKIWDTTTGKSLATLHSHKGTVMDVKWNKNGNWLVTASRDHLLKLFDIRNLQREVQTFRGHKKEASSVAWHPSHEGLFCSGGSDGAILFWHVGADKEVGAIEQAHDSIVWTLAWHPLGHILCSGSNDHTSKFWTRNRPGDLMRDKYNLNTLPAGAAGIEDHEIADEAAVIPGMGPEDRINADGEPEEKIPAAIPGLDLDNVVDEGKKFAKKVPYSKPIPRNFQAHWNEMEAEEGEHSETLNAFVNQLIETTPGAVPLTEVTPHAIILHGKVINVEPGSKLADAIIKGNDAINKLVNAGEIEELRDVTTTDPVVEEVVEPEEFLNDEGDIDFGKVPDIDLPPPLPSSKFAQNPDLLKSLNRGGKRKFDQLIGWGDGGASDRTGKNHQAVYGGSTADDWQQDEDMRGRMMSGDGRRYDEDLRVSSCQDYRHSSTNYGQSSSLDGEHYSERERDRDRDRDRDRERERERERDRDRDGRSRWDDDTMMGGSSNDGSGRNNYDKRDMMPPNMGNNMQNINPNMPPPGMMPGPGMSGGIHHPNFGPPNFGINGPPPPTGPNFNPNFRPPNGNYGPSQHFRPNPMAPFAPNPPPGPFNNNNFPPPNYRGQNPGNSGPGNFERTNFGREFRGNQMPPGPNAGGGFNQGFGGNNFGGNGGGGHKNGPPNRGMNRPVNDNNGSGRNNYNNRGGRGRDGDQSRGSRPRDNY